MADAGMVLMTVEIHGEKPGIGQAAEILGVGPTMLDGSFGVVAVDPGRHLYAVQVRASALPASQAGTVRGPFSNPRIAPFGPPR